MIGIPIKWSCIIEYDFSKILGKDFVKGEVKILPSDWINYCKAKQEFMKWHYRLVKHINKRKMKKLNNILSIIQKEINGVKV